MFIKKPLISLRLTSYLNKHKFLTIKSNVNKLRVICFFNSAMTWGGGEKWHFEIASFLQEKGFKVLFITSPKSELHKKLSNTSIEYILIKVTNLSFLNPIKINHVKNIISKNKIDTLIINLSSDLKLAGIAGKLAGVKRIIYRRGSAIPIINSFMNQFYFKNVVTDVLANSESTKNTVLENNPLLISNEKIKVIYNPLNTQDFLSKPYSKIYKKQNEEFVIGNLGRLVPQKNQMFLIDIASALKALNISFKIIIGGTGVLEGKLKAYTVEKDVADKVLFVGFVENVKDLLMSCDIFILPSLWEGFGYVIAEASLCKKPTIAFNISSNPELVINNETGFLTPVNDKIQFLNKLKVFLNEPDKVHCFGEDAFNFTSQNFDEGKIKNQILDYLSK